jgi:hypothetical protein
MLVPLNKIVKTGSLETRKGPSREAQERSALDVPGGRKRGGETEKQCLRREIKEELPKLKLGGLKLWKEVEGSESPFRAQDERRHICRQRGVG